MNSPVKESEFLIKLRELVADVLDVDEELIGRQTHFVNDLGVDSLMALELMVTLEREYKLKLTEADLRQMVCLQEIHDLLHMKLDGTALADAD